MSGKVVIARTSIVRGRRRWRRIPRTDHWSSVVARKTFVYRNEAGLHGRRRALASAVDRRYLQSTSAFRSVECGIGLQSWGCRYARVPYAELSTAVLLCLWDVKDLVLQRTDKHRTLTVESKLTRYGSGTCLFTRNAMAAVSGRSTAVVFRAVFMLSPLSLDAGSCMCCGTVMYRGAVER